jgi:hypothetical protein
MINIFASTLADCLESIDRGELTPQECLQKYPKISEELAKLLELAFLLKNTSVQLPDEHFERDARARILSTSFEQNPTGLINWLKRSLAGVAIMLSPRPVLKSSLLAILLVVLLGSGVVFASAQAMPGDFLYPVKIFLEDARLTFTSDEKDTNLQINLANERIKEIDRMVQEEEYDSISDVIDRYVIHMDHAVESISSQTPVPDFPIDPKSESIFNDLNTNIEVLSGLLDKVPEQAVPAIENAIEASSKNQDKLNELFPDGKPGGGPKDKD